MWNLKVNKEPKNQQESRVKVLLKEMAEYSYATYAEQFKNHFKEQVKEIPKYNNFSAEHTFRVIEDELKTVSVWKVKPDGELKCRMFTLTYQEE